MFFVQKSILTNHNSIFCDVNNHWVHAHCTKLSDSDFQSFCDEDDSIPWCVLNVQIIYFHFKIALISNSLLRKCKKSIP